MAPMVEFRHPSGGASAPGAPPRRGLACRAPRWLSHAWLVAAKDLRIELRSGEVTITSGFFALLVVVISSMAFHGGGLAGRVVAAGAIWLSIAFAAVLAVGRSWQHESEQGALRGLLVTPISRSALFAGKAAALTLFLLAITGVVVSAAVVLFTLDPRVLAVPLAAVALSAIPGIAASATLFGAMTRVGARHVLLAVVVLPLLAPTLLAAVTATRALLDGAALTELGDHLRLIWLFDGIFCVGGLGLFGGLVDE